MIHECEDLLICDLAETYHLFNYREVSPIVVASLLVGLRDDSRVKMHYSDTKITLDQMLMAMMVDSLKFISWTFTQEARRGKPYKQKSVLKTLQGEYESEKDDLESFSTVEEFNAYMEQFNR